MAAAEPARTAGYDHLPPEIWREVLVRVPAKSTLRCRSVCKSWYSLVSCPSFISYYETLNKNRNSRLLLEHFDIRSVSFTSFDESFMESREHDDFPEGSQDIFGGSHFVGSCNGLICLCKYEQDVACIIIRGITFFVWNPTIRKIVELPSRICSRYPSYAGFGFDSKTSDYKVLCAIDNVVEIFYLSKGVWRSISPLMPPYRVGFGFSSQECYLDGAVHWTNRSEMVLLSFNMSDECFRDIKMPDLLRNSSINIRTVTFRGLINMIAWNTRWSCSVWVMKEYGVAESWTKVSNISLPINRISPNMSTLLWGNGEVLMVNNADFGSRRHLVLYNIKRRRFKEVSQTIDKQVGNMCLYQESLVLM